MRRQGSQLEALYRKGLCRGECHHFQAGPELGLSTPRVAALRPIPHPAAKFSGLKRKSSHVTPYLLPVSGFLLSFNTADLGVQGLGMAQPPSSDSSHFSHPFHFLLSCQRAFFSGLETQSSYLL